MKRIEWLLTGTAMLLVCTGCGNDAPQRTGAGDSGTSAAEPGEDAALIENALSGGPDYVAHDAAVLLPGAEGMRVLRAGTNGWTCFPDNPRFPGNMPMCLDSVGVQWMMAVMQGTAPPADAPVSTAYLLQGSSFPSFADPDAAAPPEDGDWYTTGPILMIMNVRGRLDGVPSGEENARVPFVMWRGTPYEHLMIPLQ